MSAYAYACAGGQCEFDAPCFSLSWPLDNTLVLSAIAFRQAAPYLGI